LKSSDPKSWLIYEVRNTVKLLCDCVYHEGVQGSESGAQLIQNIVSETEVSRQISVQAALRPQKKLSLRSHSKPYNLHENFYPCKFFVKNVKLQLVVFMEIDANRNTGRKKKQM
jgi:hypothetical protein